MSVINVLGDPTSGLVGTEEGQAIALIDGGYFTPTNPNSAYWQPNFVYYVGQLQTYAQVSYRCLVNHTSTDSFQTDYLVSDLWTVASKTYNPKEWKPKTLYATDTIVLLGYIQLTCLVNHVSGSSILADLATGGMWDFLPQRAKLLSDHISEDPFYSSLLDAMDRSTIANVDILLWKLLNIRNFNADTELAVLTLTGAMLGFDLTRYLLADNDSIFRFITQVAKFRYVSGLPVYANFLGFLLGSSLVVTYLWTNDYVHFVPQSEIPSGAVYAYQNPSAAGAWYSTTHATLEFDLSLIWPTLSLASRLAIGSTIRQLFYDFAPIAFVAQTIILDTETCPVNVINTLTVPAPIPEGSLTLDCAALRIVTCPMIVLGVMSVTGSEMIFTGTCLAGLAVNWTNLTGKTWGAATVVADGESENWSAAVIGLAMGVNRICIIAGSGMYMQAYSCLITRTA